MPETQDSTGSNQKSKENTASITVCFTGKKRSIKAFSPRVKQEFKRQLHQFLAANSCANYLPSQSLSFLICKNGDNNKYLCHRVAVKFKYKLVKCTDYSKYSINIGYYHYHHYDHYHHMCSVNNLHSIFELILQEGKESINLNAPFHNNTFVQRASASDILPVSIRPVTAWERDHFSRDWL